jgi:hypothetical protein
LAQSDIFQVTKAEVPYWRVEDPEHFSIGSFPVFKVANMMDKENIQQFFYGLPILEYPGLLKVRHCTITSVLPKVLSV